MKGFGTLDEVKWKWTLKDLMDAHEVMDLMEEAEEWASKQKGT